MTRQTTVISVRIDNALAAAIRTYAEETGIPASQQVKRALSQFFAAKDGEFKSLRKRIAAQLDAKETK